MTGKRLLIWNVIGAVALLVVLFVPDPALKVADKPQNVGYMDRSGQVNLPFIGGPFDPSAFEQTLSKFP